MRSKLFVPGARPELFAKAFVGPADAISFDLEDAVLDSRKGEARAEVGKFLQHAASNRKVLIVRVNALETGNCAADIEAVACSRLDAVNLPKVESPESIRIVAQILTRLETERGIPRRIGILANIESGRGLRLAADIAAADSRVVGLQIGFGDLFGPLRIDRSNARAVEQVQLAVRLAAGEAGIAAYDGAFADIRNVDAFKAECERAAALGFTGKSCIHPSQVQYVNAAFMPREEEVRRAQRIVQAWEQAMREGRGAVVVDGQMIDIPVARHAQQLIALAERLGNNSGSAIGEQRE